MKRIIMAEFSDIRYDARVLKEAKSLADKGYIVQLLMYNASIRHNTYSYNNGIFSHAYSFNEKHRDTNIFFKIIRILKAVCIVVKINFYILTHKADVYHVHNLYFSVSSTIASIIFKSKLIYDAHEIHCEHYDNSSFHGKIKNKINEYIEMFVIRHCDAFIQASTERAHYISYRFKLRTPHVINNYVPLKIINDLNKEIPANLNFEQKFPIMFYSGGIYSAGGRKLENVIQAMKIVEYVNLVIIGFMNDRIKKQLYSFIRNTKLTSRVKILPPCSYEDLFNYAQYCNFGIIPLTGNSLNTRLSALNKVSEYLMSGLPIICTNYENLSRIIYNNPVGLIGSTFDVNSTRSIADAIRLMIADNLFLDLKPNALKLAHNYFNWEKEEIKLLNIYESILF